MNSPLEFTLPHRLELEAPHMADYFGIWSIHGPTFRQMATHCEGVNLHVHMAAPDVQERMAERDQKIYGVTSDGIAQFQVRGPTMKAVPSMADGTSTVRLRQQLNAARRDPEVRGGIVLGDTPGGTSKGNEDAAAAFAAFAAEKPLYYFAEDMTASAGVQMASHATKRFANNATAMYGAMGTYAVIEDTSGVAEDLHVKVHVIAAGAYKGMGEPGTPITEEHLQELHRIVNTLNESYLQSIANGLGKSVGFIRSMADGRVIMAADAVEAGLLDGVQTLEETYRQLVAATTPAVAVPVPSGTPTERTVPMADTTPQAATLAELKKHFPDSTADWREQQMESGADLQTSAINYASHVSQQAAARQEEMQAEMETLRTAQAATATGSLGQPPLAPANADGEIEPGETGDPVEDFDNAVQAVKARGLGRKQAVKHVKQRQQGLWRSYLLATNTDSRRTRQLKEKFEMEDADMAQA